MEAAADDAAAEVLADAALALADVALADVALVDADPLPDEQPTSANAATRAIAKAAVAMMCIRFFIFFLP